MACSSHALSPAQVRRICRCRRGSGGRACRPCACTAARSRGRHGPCVASGRTRAGEPDGGHRRPHRHRRLRVWLGPFDLFPTAPFVPAAHDASGLFHLAPPRIEGERSAERRLSRVRGATIRACEARGVPYDRDARLSALHRGDFRPGAALLGFGGDGRSGSIAASHSRPGRSARRAGPRRLPSLRCKPQPRAPLPAPPSGLASGRRPSMSRDGLIYSPRNKLSIERYCTY